jgi:hypothetical protein
MKGINFCTVVYGDNYLDNFYNYVLPSLLSKDNFPYFCSRIKCNYKIYTNIKGKLYLEEKLKNNLLCKYLEIQINTKIVEKNINKDKVKLANLCYSDCLDFCRLSDFGFIWIFADGVHSKENLKNIYNFISNKKIIFVPSIVRANAETIKKMLSNYINKSTLEINTFDLSNLMFKSLVIQQKNKYLNNYVLVKNAEQLFWPVDEDGVIVSTLSLNPIFINSSNAKTKYIYEDISIEASSYLQNLYTDKSEIKFINDNKHFLIACIENDKPVGISNDKDNFFLRLFNYYFLVNYFAYYLKSTIKSPEFIKNFDKTSEFFFLKDIDMLKWKIIKDKSKIFHKRIMFVYKLINIKIFFLLLRELFRLFFYLKSKFFYKKYI